ncbi:ABC transporter permease [Caldibacillus lycopersici]|uniref:ABC transporter permease n=1 Tax=Perspicuibacillus lycopersici TaxID=1325689 RepID=A0AAE3ITQ6_9BACI|nr:ABC transporter permease [Perspicuibacillus lycopersici]MCU9612599.1 ABC transporter permease [Perspicuibacillus lycopersici]
MQTNISPASQPSMEAPKGGNFRKIFRIFLPFFSNAKSTVGFIIFCIFVVIAIFAPIIAPYDPSAAIHVPNLSPTADHWFGTTNTGQDIYSQFIYSARSTMVVGFGAGILSTIIGLIFGVVGGYRGGLTDAILGFITNIFLVMPGLALMIVIQAYLTASSPYLTGLIIALTGWAWGARVFRAQTMTLANRDFILAAKMSGMSSFRIMVTQICPNMMSIIAGNIMFATLGAILAEAGLAFLGFEDINSISWGTMLYWASNNAALIRGAWWWFIPPGLGIGLVGLSLVLMNFAVDQITNPRLKVQKRRKNHGSKAARA